MATTSFDSRPVAGAPGVTRSRTTTLLGIAVLVGSVLWFFLAFVATGPDERQVGDVVVGQ